LDFKAGTQFNTLDLYLGLGAAQFELPLNLKGLPFQVKLGLLVRRRGGEYIMGNPHINVVKPMS